jgi:membrane-associated phospholipid phosphatase
MNKTAKLSPLDIITFGYLILTGLLIICFIHIAEQPFRLLGIRLFLIAGIIGLAIYHHKKPDAKVLGFFRNIYPVVLLSYLYPETDTLNNFLFKENLDPFFASLESMIFRFQPSITFQQNFPFKWFQELMNFGYFSFYILIIVFILWMYIKNKENFTYTTFIIICSFYLYYLIFIIVPVAGPQYYFSDLINSESVSGVFGWFMNTIHTFGERPTAAFPSSHIGICCLLLFFTFKYAKPLFLWYCVLVSILTLSTIYIRAHYVIDIFGGIVAFVLIYMISKGLYRMIHSERKNLL